MNNKILSSTPPGERMPKAEDRKLFRVAVGDDPFAAGLNGKGCKPDMGIRLPVATVFFQTLK